MAVNGEEKNRTLLVIRSACLFIYLFGLRDLSISAAHISVQNLPKIAKKITTIFIVLQQ